MEMAAACALLIAPEQAKPFLSVLGIDDTTIESITSNDATVIDFATFKKLIGK